MDIQDVIQAFADGEPVDPVELDRALADPEGRAHLIDIVVLRKLVRQSHAAVPALSAGAEAARSRPRTLRWLAAAAAVAVVASAGGYFYGERASTSREPIAEHVVTVPADAPPADATAPPPTVVIRFQPGVDWTERGGH